MSLFTTVNRRPRPPEPVAPNFSWAATGPPITFTEDGDVFTPGGQEVLVFTSTLFDATDSGSHGYPKTLTPPGVTIVQYRWDFGDGTIGYGPQVAHTFMAATPDCEVSLGVLDSRGRRYSISRVVTLVAGLMPAGIVAYRIRA